MVRKNIDINTIGGRIAAKRMELGLTQQEAAERLCIAPALYSHYENNRVDIKTSVIKEIANAFGTSAGYLIDGPENVYDERENTLILIFNSLETDSLRDAALAQMKILNGLAK